MECLAPYGRLVVFGNATGSYAEINTGLLHGSCRSVLGYSSVTTRKTRPQWFVDTAPEVIRLMEEGRSAGKIVLTVPGQW
jgi:NADPH2:quinone reductase